MSKPSGCYVDLSDKSKKVLIELKQTLKGNGEMSTLDECINAIIEWYGEIADKFK